MKDVLYIYDMVSYKLIRLYSVFNLLICLLFINKVFSQNCENVGFENGDFEGWQAYIGHTTGINYANEGIVMNRHTIISEALPDPNTGGSLITFPNQNGGDYVVRLGNSNVGAEAEVLRKVIHVTEANKLFLYQYAVVLEDPGHPSDEQPKFEVKLYDSQNNIVSPIECGLYKVVAGPETENWKSFNEVKFKDWTTIGIDLSTYLNQKITIEFYVQDCAQGGHFGYAYVNASCHQFEFNVESYCASTNLLTLSAPVGFYSYNWENTGDTTYTITTNTISNGDMVDLKLTSETQCVSHIVQKMDNLYPVYIGDDTVLCQHKSYTIQAYNVFGSYEWSTGDTTSTIEVYETGDYFIFNKDTACVDQDTVHVEFLPFAEIGQIPNIFTPSADAINDEFYFYSKNIENFELLIYNRWGNLMFETTNPFDYWDGYFKDTIVNEGVYFYKIRHTIDCENKTYKINGIVTVDY